MALSWEDLAATASQAVFEGLAGAEALRTAEVLAAVGELLPIEVVAIEVLSVRVLSVGVLAVADRRAVRC